MKNYIRKLIEDEKYNEAYTAANNLFYNGDFESAYEIYDEVYETICEEQGRSSPQAYHALKRLALLDEEGGRNEEALRLFNIYLEYVSENYGKVGTDYYEIYSKAAGILEYGGEFEKAAAIRNEILSFCLKKYGDSSAEAITALGGLAWNIYSSGKVKESLDLFLQQYEMAYASKECNTRQYYHILQNIGRCYEDLNENDKALEYLEMAYKAAVKVFGKKNEEALSVLNDIAGIYSRSGRITEALKRKEKIYNTMKEIMGEDCHNTNMAKLNLGSVYGEAGDFQKNLELTKEAYEWFVNTLGYNHSSTMIAMTNLSNAYSRQNNYEKALELREKLYSISVEVYGNDSPKAMEYFLYLAKSYADVGQMDTATEIADEVCRRQHELAKSDPQYILCSLAESAYMHMKAEHYDKVLEKCDEYFDITKSQGGETLFDLELVYYVQAKAMSRLGRHDEALTAIEKYNDVCETVYNNDESNPYYIDSLHGYAQILYRAGQLDKALKITQYTIEMYEKYNFRFMMINDHYQLLSDIYKSLGRNEEAEQILKQMTDRKDN